MGGCASRPKDLDFNEAAPAPIEAPAVENVESETVAQENNGGEETKTEEPLVDLSEPAVETNETAESKPAEETTEVAETKAEEKVEAEAEAEAEAAPAEVATTSEAEKTPEPVEEAEVVEAQTSEDKSDAPLVTM